MTSLQSESCFQIRLDGGIVAAGSIVGEVEGLHLGSIDLAYGYLHFDTAA